MKKSYQKHVRKPGTPRKYHTFFMLPRVHFLGYSLNLEIVAKLGTYFLQKKSTSNIAEMPIMRRIRKKTYA